METILIVDDERQVRQVLVRLLEAEGYSCLAAEDSNEARRTHFDPIVLDVLFETLEKQSPSDAGDAAVLAGGREL